MQVISGRSELAGLVGQHLGYSDWITITQDRIDKFADATDDHQWIHVDPERAARGPFGTTIAHGYLTLSMLPMFASEIYRIDGVELAINYGLNKVRFLSPVPVGSAVRAGIEILDVSSGPAGIQMTKRTTVEMRGADKPVCVAETVAFIPD